MKALLAVLLALFVAPAFAQPSSAGRIQLGQAVAPLNGPWKFASGDDYRWSEPGWNDGGWQNVDLTADDDPNAPVPGWAARGHPAYAGFGWYRLKVNVDGLGGAPLAISGPMHVDGAYQLFVDGKLVGQMGDFGGALPAPRAIQPLLVKLGDGGAPNRDVSIAVRVWTPGPMTADDGGGLRAAPRLGRFDDVRDLVRLQWLRTLKSGLADLAEGLGFIVLALMVVGLVVIDRKNEGYAWLAAALGLTAAIRLNEVIYLWTALESFPLFDTINSVILTAAALFAWVQTWRFWRDGERAGWLTAALAGLTGLYMAAAFGDRPWLQPGNPSHAAFDEAVIAVRIVYLGFYLWYAGRVTWKARTQWQGVLAFVAATCAAVALFAPELTRYGMTEAWLPFGLVFSRTQFALAALVAAMFAAIIERFVRHSQPMTPEVEDDGWGPVPVATLKPAPVTVPARFRSPFAFNRNAR